jgi:signal transduction histidine kinase
MTANGWPSFLHPDDRDDTVCAWEKCIRAGESWSREMRFRGVDGQYHWILGRGLPIRDDTGRVTRYAGVNIDISELKAAEEHLRVVNESLARANEELEYFAYAVTHDLKGPLRHVHLFAELLVKELKGCKLDEQSMAYLNYIDSGTQRAEKLLDDLMSLTQLNIGPVSIDDVDLNAIVKQVIADLDSTIAATNAHVVVDVLPHVRMNETHARSVVPESDRKRSQVPQAECHAVDSRFRARIRRFLHGGCEGQRHRNTERIPRHGFRVIQASGREQPFGNRNRSGAVQTNR